MFVLKKYKNRWALSTVSQVTRGVLTREKYCENNSHLNNIKPTPIDWDNECRI